MRGNVFVDVEKCVACKRCEIACAVEHSKSKDLQLAIHESTRPEPRVDVFSMGGFSVPLECRHCENAQCVAACPTGAMTRDGVNSPVHIQNHMCVGCRNCVIVCHFGVPKLSKNGKAVIKCDQCMERLDRDEFPACVSACPTGALTFKDAETVSADFRNKSFVERFAVRS